MQSNCYASLREFNLLQDVEAEEKDKSKEKNISEATDLWARAISGLVEIFLSDKMDARRDSITCLAQIADKSCNARKFVMKELRDASVSFKIQWVTSGVTGHYHPIFTFGQSNGLEDVSVVSTYSTDPDLTLPSGVV